MESYTESHQLNYFNILVVVEPSQAQIIMLLIENWNSALNTLIWYSYQGFSTIDFRASQLITEIHLCCIPPNLFCETNTSPIEIGWKLIKDSQPLISSYTFLTSKPVMTPISSLLTHLLWCSIENLQFSIDLVDTLSLMDSVYSY